MRKVWTLATLLAFIVAVGGIVAARQPQTKPTTQKPTVKKEAKTEKDEDEKEEQEKAGSKVTLPAPVAAAFKKAYPTAVIKASAKEIENGKTIYEVESVDKGMNRDLLYAEDGTVLECEEQIKDTDVPAPVMAALKKAYPKATITKAERTTKGKDLQYDFTLSGAPVPEASFLPDGRPVVAAPEKK